VKEQLVTLPVIILVAFGPARAQDDAVKKEWSGWRDAKPTEKTPRTIAIENPKCVIRGEQLVRTAIPCDGDPDITQWR
jgi:hypothetical protein